MAEHITEMLWRGERIVQVPCTVDMDARGFKVTQAFRVLDDFGDDALPFVQQWFWSPNDAIAAIEARDTILPLREGKKWPTTAQYEYNTMLVYRSSFFLVYAALHQIRKALREAKDFDDNPAAEITRILDTLHQSAYQMSKGHDR